ncbi:phage tail assembly chaperone GT [Virgibacillus sp. MG-45]
MDKLIVEMMKNGKDINEILDMPIHFVMELMKEKNKPRKEKSLIAAFGGG